MFVQMGYTRRSEKKCVSSTLISNYQTEVRRVKDYLEASLILAIQNDFPDLSKEDYQMVVNIANQVLASYDAGFRYRRYCGPAKFVFNFCQVDLKLVANTAEVVFSQI